MPTLRSTNSKVMSMFVVFLFSAVFHEFIVSVPFRTNSMYAFGAMMMQIPLIVITKSLNKITNGSPIGNIYIYIIIYL